MPLPWAQVDAVLTKVYDLLRFDERTMDIAWTNGRRILAEAKTHPAGSVYLGPGQIVPETMPGGDLIRMRVVVEVATMAYEQVPAEQSAERLLRGYIDQVAEVLVNNNWDLGLDYAYATGLIFDPMLAEEHVPPYARARCFLDVEIRPA